MAQVKTTRLFASGTALVAVAAASYFLLRPQQQGTGNREQGTEEGIRDKGKGIRKEHPTPNTQHPTPTSSSTLNLLGTILPGTQAQLSARQPARITGVYVKEGQTVLAGQILAQLDAAEARAGEATALTAVRTAQAQEAKARSGRIGQLVKADADIKTAQAGLAHAQAKRRQAQLGVQAARASDQADLQTAQAAVHKAEEGVKTAQTQLRSLEELSKVGGVARNDLEGARTQAQIAQTDLESAREAVRRVQAGPPDQPGTSFRVANALQEANQAQSGVAQALAGVKTARDARAQILSIADADIRIAEAATEQARSGLASASIGQTMSRLVSPINGIASNVNAHVGETAQPGQPLLIILAPSGARVEALVPARQLALLRVGQAARVTLDTRPNQPLLAIVYSIAGVAEPDGRAFRVTFHFTSPPSGLRLGQTARVTIEREKEKGERRK